MFNLITIAQASTSSSSGSSSSGLIMILLLIAMFYFLMIRPENKRKKEAQQMRDSLTKGTYVTTIGGLYGKVVAITDNTVVIETSDDRVRVEFIKSAIGSVGTLEEQAAAQQQQQRPSLFGKKKAADENKAESNEINNETLAEVVAETEEKSAE